MQKQHDEYVVPNKTTSKLVTKDSGKGFCGLPFLSSVLGDRYIHQEVHTSLSSMGTGREQAEGADAQPWGAVLPSHPLEDKSYWE